MRRACYEAIRTIDSTLPISLIDDLKPTKSSDDMLDVLAQSPYWNWFDTRLLQALVSASGSAEAEALLEQFKQIHYSRRVDEILPYVSVVPLKNSVFFTEKFNKEANELTLLDIINHKHILEYEILDTRDEKIVLRYIKTGCVELTWQVPQELVYRAYTSMKRKHDELSSLAITSLVCKEGDEAAGLPYLWCGQEVGKVGPIEPLPEHVRQEPYSLPQGFQWVTLSSSNVEELAKFSKTHRAKLKAADLQYITMYPHTRSEWQFGIRTTNGKLVGVMLAHHILMNIGEVSKMCVCPTTWCHRKYQFKRMQYMLLKELQRRANLYGINQFCRTGKISLLKPVTTIIAWSYHFTYHANNLLPSSPRTPGWRKMTSEDVPSALAFVNKYSSQFEIRQVFTSEEEFSHYFLCPAVPNFVFTYVVENETNNITDVVSYHLRTTDKMHANITTVVSTHSPVEQLIMDVLTCARDEGAKYVIIQQYNIESDVLLSLSFQPLSLSLSTMLYFYNYNYLVLSQTKCFYPTL